MSNYVLSAEAIIYAAAVAGARSITGLPNVYGGQTEAERKTAVTAAKEELQKAGLLSMDFDGNETVDEKLLTLIKTAAWASQITGYDLKEADGNKVTFTYYRNTDGSAALLTSDSGEEGKYKLTDITESEAAELLKKKLAIKAENVGIAETVALNLDVKHADREKLTAAGASPELVELIAASILGGGCAITMRRFVLHVEDVSYALLFNDKAVVKMDIFYEDGEEKARLTPVSADEAYGMITELLKESDFDPFYGAESDPSGDGVEE